MMKIGMNLDRGFEKKTSQVNDMRKTFKNLMENEIKRKIDEAIDSQKYLAEKLELEAIAKKVARGEILTAEERVKIEKLAPEKLRKAQEARMKAIQVQQRMKQAKTTGEAQQIYTEEYNKVTTIPRQGDEEAAVLDAEAMRAIQKQYTEEQFLYGKGRDHEGKTKGKFRAEEQ